jgi:hypothetical protein
MDFAPLETDLTTTLKRLPPDFLSVVSRLIVTHKDTLAACIPHIIEDLKAHIGTAIMENAMGILDKKALEATVFRALKNHGIDVPPELMAL